ncbi:DUF1697 domain-containing protein [uncultured Psychroserpens sp.]|uniref:DUF1697 domain-containing protein n=1 Tax=uncultured Psychroserpens sp. TaxID=255436 RepID=UPI002623A019|nr:DUF1697 domain-containing protein [uncultured Psychroserpens sp.]
MNTYIVLLRGINVGGHKKVPMAELRELLSKCGFNAVKTYIQTGNIILQSSEDNHNNVEQMVHQSILDHFGFDVPVIAKTRDQLIKILDACPFSEIKKEQCYFVLLSALPELKSLKEVEHISYDNEEYQIVNDCLYFFTAAGYGKSKFNMNMFEKKLDVRATSRNFKTMVKLIDLSTVV